RDEIKPLAAKLGKLEQQRGRLIEKLGGYEKAKADRLAPAAGLSVSDIVALVPALGPKPAGAQVEQQSAEPAPAPVPAPAPAPAGALAPDLRQPVPAAAAAEPPQDAVSGPSGPSGDSVVDVAAEPAAAPSTPPAPGTVGRELPSIPAGAEGDRWAAVTPNLASTRPNFVQQVRQMAFLDAGTGELVHRDQALRVDIGTGSVAEILTAVYAVLP
ncbi:hypothetical protein ACXZ65_39620, partial [Streptomyces aculeolatus]